jgi:hypothetical protein
LSINRKNRLLKNFVVDKQAKIGKLKHNPPIYKNQMVKSACMPKQVQANTFIFTTAKNSAKNKTDSA